MDHEYIVGLGINVGNVGKLFMKTGSKDIKSGNQELVIDHHKPSIKSSRSDLTILIDSLESDNKKLAHEIQDFEITIQKYKKEILDLKAHIRLLSVHP